VLKVFLVAFDQRIPFSIGLFISSRVFLLFFSNAKFDNGNGFALFFFAVVMRFLLGTLNNNNNIYDNHFSSDELIDI